jgi:antitoxin VapB
MGLNIKSERVHELARALSAATGKNMTAVIEEALEEKLRRLRDEEDRDGQIAEALAFIKSLGPPPAGLSSDHSDLYDDKGLFA